jgi:adenylate kinase
MDKKQRFEYIQEVEHYLEENTNPSSDSEYFTHVYELFTSLQKQLLIHRPENPIDFLINRLGRKTPTKIFIVGPPGCESKKIATALSEHFLFDKISLGDILLSES